MLRLVSCLSSLGFKVEPVEEHKGPTVTRYEVKPHPKVRVESLCRVEQSVAVALAAHSVRIVGCLPGKGTVGIEVAAKDRKTVPLDSVGVGQGVLPIALGVEVGGAMVCPDLAEMPHLLIAGSTGSGKSVCLSALLCSLVQRQGPDTLRLLLIDPKQVELCAFSSLPHLLCPIITKADKAVTALDWLTREMGRRYTAFASLGVKNIAGWNAKSRKEDKLPRIVVVIDELADLMIAAKGETEDVVGRLSALARASGIHLVVATQRPSVNVVTGRIKANLPSRIAFRVTSQVDSRVILDTKGAESLVGKGDALFVQPGQMEPLRVQCCYVSDEQIAAIVEKAGEGLTQTFVDGVETAIPCESSQSDTGGGSEPVLFSIDRAMAVLREYGYAQTKLLASACHWPVETAQACIDEMERREIVGKGSPEAPREVLVTLNY